MSWEVGGRAYFESGEGREARGRVEGVLLSRSRVLLGVISYEREAMRVIVIHRSFFAAAFFFWERNWF